MQQNRTTYVTIMTLHRLEGRDPEGTPSLTSCSHQVQYSRVLRALYCQGVSISKRSSHSLSGQSAPIFDYPYLSFPLYQVGVSCVPASDCSLSSFQSAPLALSLLHAPNTSFASPVSHLFLKLSKPSSLSCSLYSVCSSLVVFHCACYSMVMLFFCWGAANRTKYPGVEMWSHKC